MTPPPNDFFGHDFATMKLDIVGKDLGEYSLETVKMFRDDAVKAGFKL